MAIKIERDEKRKIDTSDDGRQHQSEEQSRALTLTLTRAESLG